VKEFMIEGEHHKFDIAGTYW